MRFLSADDDEAMLDHLPPLSLLYDLGLLPPLPSSDDD